MRVSNPLLMFSVSGPDFSYHIAPPLFTSVDQIPDMLLMYVPARFVSPEIPLDVTIQSFSKPKPSCARSRLLSPILGPTNFGGRA